MTTQEEIWYYMTVPYLTGRNKGKLHYEYNWDVLEHEINRVLNWFEGRGIQPTVRQIHYHFTQLKPARIPNMKKCYQKLDEFITRESMQGIILNAQSNNHRTLIILIVNVKEALKGR